MPDLFFLLIATPPPELYTLSLHDALPIWVGAIYPRQAWSKEEKQAQQAALTDTRVAQPALGIVEDRKSTRLNSSHPSISYAVFCLKKKKPIIQRRSLTRSLEDGQKYDRFR